MKRLLAFANNVTASFANAMLAGESFEVVDGGDLFTPFGEFKHKQGLQRFDAAAAQSMVTNFNKPMEKLKRWANAGVPIYVGHPDVPGMQAIYNDKKAYGWVTGLEVEADGMRIKVKWSEPGAQLISNAHYRFHSPFWNCEEDKKGKAWTPVMLCSVGLTNTPNIPVPAIANEADEVTDHMPPETLNKPTPSTNLMKIEWKKKLGLAEDADEAAFENALNALHQKCTDHENTIADLNAKKTLIETEKNTLANDITLARAEAVTARTARVENAISGLVSSAKLLPADVDAQKVRLIGLANESEVTEELIKLNAVDPKMKTKSVTDGAAGGKSKLMENIESEEGRKAALANALDEEYALVIKELGESNQAYDIAFNRVQRKKPELFKRSAAA